MEKIRPYPSFTLPKKAGSPTIRLVSTNAFDGQESSQENTDVNGDNVEYTEERKDPILTSPESANLSTPFPLLPIVTASRRWASLPVLLSALIVMLMVATSILGTRLWMMREVAVLNNNTFLPTAVPLPTRTNAPPPTDTNSGIAINAPPALEPINPDDATLNALTESVSEAALAPPAKAFPIPEIVVHDDDPTPSEIDDQTLEEAEVAQTRGDLAGAYALYKAALGTRTPEAAPRAWQGVLYTLEGLGGTTSYRELSILAQRGKHRADVYATMGSVALQIGLYPQAITALDRALASAKAGATQQATPPTLLAWQRARAIALDRAGKLTEARDAYRQILANNPQEVQDGALSARLAWITGRLEEK